MATAAQINQLRRSQVEVERLVRRDMRRLWTGLRNVPPEQVRDAILQLAPSLSDQYGAVSASMAAEWFESVTQNAAVVGAAVPRDAVEASVRYGAGPLWRGQSELAFERIASSVTRHSMQQGRNTVARSSRRNGMTYARAPEPGACAWCLMLSSRGATYTSEAAAGGGGNSYHDDCKCMPEPAQRGQPLSYDHNELYSRYSGAFDSGDSDREVASKMRELYGLP